MDNKINERIAAYRVRLIDEMGENRGEMLKSAAIEQARRVGLDLVEMTAGVVPVCKITNYGKMMYQKSKAAKHQKQPSMKEMRISYGIAEHDLEIKRKKIEEFLTSGHKVFISIQLKGRQKYSMKVSAKEKFTSFILSLAPNFDIGSIKDGPDGFNVVLDPGQIQK